MKMEDVLWKAFNDYHTQKITLEEYNKVRTSYRYAPIGWKPEGVQHQVNITDEQMKIMKLEDESPINMIRNEMFSKHHVSDLVRVFVEFTRAKYDLSMYAETKLVTEVHIKLKSENDIHDCFKVLLDMCKEYRMDSYCIRFAYNRMVDRCIDAILRDIRKQVSSELMR